MTTIQRSNKPPQQLSEISRKSAASRPVQHLIAANRLRTSITRRILSSETIYHPLISFRLFSVSFSSARKSQSSVNALPFALRFFLPLSLALSLRSSNTIEIFTPRHLHSIAKYTWFALDSCQVHSTKRFFVQISLLSNGPRCLFGSWIAEDQCEGDWKGSNMAVRNWD